MLCLQALKLYERVPMGELQQGGLWAKWADCHIQMDNLPAAVNIYVSVANGKSLAQLSATFKEVLMKVPQASTPQLCRDKF